MTDSPPPNHGASDGHDAHASISRWERRWLALSGLISVTFVVLIAWNLATDGAHVAQREQHETPEEILAQARFAQPGLRTVAPGRFQLSIVAQAFAFDPQEVTLPVGAEVEFHATARDVLHGYQLANTNVNVELIPGEVSVFRYTFDRAGEYRVTCNEYCGIGHHDMLGVIHVVPQSEFSAQGRVGDVPTADAAGVSGEAVYSANCVSCHQANGQGLPGAFPPLAGHVPDLLADQGREYLVDTLLYGLQGPIEVDGSRYNGVMPAWAQLSDAEIAAVLEYISTEWGNAELRPDGSAAFGPDEIAAQRGRGLNGQDVWNLRSSAEGAP